MKNYNAQLVRTVTLGSAIILVVSSVIGSGVYKKAAKMSDLLGSPKLVLLAWLFAGIISLFGALSNAEIAGMMADSGGEYVYFKRIYGRFMSFIFGWSIFSIIKTASVSSIAYVFTQSLNNILPLKGIFGDVSQLETMQIWIFQPFENFEIKLVTILLIIGLTFLNTRGLKGGEMFSNWITRLVIVALVMIAISGLFFSQGTLANISTTASNFVDRPITDISFLNAFLAAMLAAFWAYEGWNTVGFLGGEIQNPNKNLPIALFSGLMIIISAYLLVNFTYFYVYPVDKLQEVFHGQNQIAAVEVVRSYAGSFGTVVLSVIILITTLGCTNSTIIMPPRLYYAMAKDGVFFKSAAVIHPKYHTPNNALWMQCTWAAVLVLSGNFDQLTDMLIFAAFFFYGATALGVFILRKREPDAERPYRVWGYPIVPAIFIIFCVALIVNTFYTSPVEALKGMALMLTGIPFYIYWNWKLDKADKNENLNKEIIK
ncbi:MAG: APC family permease [Saprospiraceae bacterium]